LRNFKQRLTEIRARIHHARAQLALHPEVFDATEILKIAEAELTALIAEMFPDE
jgi:hypothetical protein